jgi:adenylosuccinate synthase
MKATAVIGAAFGDEGKGLVVDYLSAKDPLHTVVVRHNGGAQAGHTVVRPDGRRHSFSHIGSGTFAGAATYLARTFLVNPLLWRKERDELAKVNLLDPSGMNGGVEKTNGHGESHVALPTLYVDPAAVFTTPWDMIVNRELERQRGSARHGSCGYGINETVTRSHTLPGHVGKAESPIWLRDFLRVARNYSEERFRVAGGAMTKDFLDRFLSEQVFEDFMEAMAAFLKTAVLADGLPKKVGFDHVVFEGAQGLLLDELHQFFPHVTRSRTGLPNVGTFTRCNQIPDVSVVYVMRAYMTRHGEGPFPTEDKALSYPDATNAPNEFQGSLRFGRLDVPLIAAAIRKDLTGTQTDIGKTVLAVTHLDQVNELEEVGVREMLTAATGFDVVFHCYGPCREDVANVTLSGTCRATMSRADVRRWSTAGKVLA